MGEVVHQDPQLPSGRVRVGGGGGADMNARGALGRYGEDLAARLLTDAGMAVIERNWRCHAGEVDIVARDGDALVF
ncbi:YraN family protein, partial [Streptomyces microflavus]|uniref:YraN family protein n=1 Tax=Streptomyces microflavus TaxID=1919 RepID=UPI00339FF8B5